MNFTDTERGILQASLKQYIDSVMRQRNKYVLGSKLWNNFNDEVIQAQSIQNRFFTLTDGSKK